MKTFMKPCGAYRSAFRILLAGSLGIAAGPLSAQTDVAAPESPTMPSAPTAVPDSPAAFVASPGQIANAMPRLARNARILAFGDSLTFGTGGSGSSYPQRLGQVTKLEVINAGLPGETAALGLARLPRLLAQTMHPDVIIICFGVNDFYRRIPREQVVNNMRSMLALAKEASVPVLVLAVSQPGIKAADPLFAELAEPGFVWVDEHAMADALANPGLKGDLIHPTLDGYRQIAESVVRGLRERGALAAYR